ncbi:MAG: hypothetical protein ACE5SW_08080 [Nitrososphaeraceae archaeon]
MEEHSRTDEERGRYAREEEARLKAIKKGESKTTSGDRTDEERGRYAREEEAREKKSS